MLIPVDGDISIRPVGQGPVGSIEPAGAPECARDGGSSDAAFGFAEVRRGGPAVLLEVLGEVRRVREAEHGSDAADGRAGVYEQAFGFQDDAVVDEGFGRAR